MEEFLDIKAPTDLQVTERLLASRSVRRVKPVAQLRRLSFTSLPMLLCLDFKNTITSNWNKSSLLSNNLPLRTRTEVRDLSQVTFVVTNDSDDK